MILIGELICGSVMTVGDDGLRCSFRMSVRSIGVLCVGRCVIDDFVFVVAFLRKVERIIVGGLNCGASRQERNKMKEQAEKAKEEGQQTRWRRKHVGIFSFGVVQLEFDTMRTNPEFVETKSGAEKKRAKARLCLGNMEKWVFLIHLVMFIFEVANAASSNPIN